MVFPITSAICVQGAGPGLCTWYLIAELAVTIAPIIPLWVAGIRAGYGDLVILPAADERNLRRLFGAALDHFNKALLAVDWHFVDGHDFIAGLQPRGLGGCAGFDFFNNGMIARIQIQQFQPDRVADRGGQLGTW